MQIEIQCPLHGKIETLELPDSYKDFHGEALCPSPVTQSGTSGRKGARLDITIVGGKLISVKQAR